MGLLIHLRYLVKYSSIKNVNNYLWEDFWNTILKVKQEEKKITNDINNDRADCLLYLPLSGGLPRLITNAKGKEDLKGKNIPLDWFLLHKDQGDGERSL